MLDRAEGEGGPLYDTITWGCGICFVAILFQQYYGSTHVIPTVYPPAQKYMAYMSKRERKGGLIEHGLGDWRFSIAYGNHQPNIETAIYHQCLLNMATIAQVLGLSEDEKLHAARASRIYDAYNANLLVTSDGSAYYTSLDSSPTRDRTAVAQAMALQFQMVPDAHISDIQSAFLDVTSRNVMHAGEIGLKYLLNTFGDLKRSDTVLLMARQEEHPSYMRFLRRGETTLSEFWQDGCRSKCHDMFGTI